MTLNMIRPGASGHCPTCGKPLLLVGIYLTCPDQHGNLVEANWDERRELKKAGQVIVQSTALFPWEQK